MHSVIGTGLLLLQGVACWPRPVLKPRHHITGVELSQFHFKPYDLPIMSVSCTKDQAGDPDFECSMAFTWEDPNANNSSSQCESQWEWDGVESTTPTARNSSDNGFIVCASNSTITPGNLFQFMFQTMDHPSNFSLLLSHTFVDSQDFPSPERANLYGQANITLIVDQQTPTALTYVIPAPQQAEIVGITI
ncbi:hypothetical protein F5Y16DRAFT_15084 [Xylariaceae sp. FL0255]|nr:hypothetical protein F5Y16DRAFT_15084 [Xylariaceae sp. FL0255]